MTPYDEGYAAALANLGEDANPYTDMDNANQWLTGWYSGQDFFEYEFPWER